MSFIIFIFLCLGSSSAVVAAAPAKTITATFEIVNQTEFDITTLKLALVGEEPMNKELLKKTLKRGATAKISITFNPNIHAYDLVVSKDDIRFERLDFRGITAAHGGMIVLKYNYFPEGLVFNKAGASVAGLTPGSNTTTVKFSFKNQTEDQINLIQLSLPGKEQWGQNLLKAPLLAGATVDIPITFSPKASRWDIKVGEETAQGVDFSGTTAASGGNILLGYFYDNAGVQVFSKVAPKAGLPAGSGTMTVNFNVKNETTEDYISLQISKAGKKVWSPNLLTKPLKAGATVVIPITYSEKEALWDLKGITYSIGGNFPVLTEKLDFSAITPESGGNIQLTYSLNYGDTALVTNNRPRVPYPKQSGNSIMFFDTDSDGVLSSYETKEQIKAANPNLEAGLDVSISDKVTTIGKYAFEFVPIKKLTLPASVTTILDNAFANNTYLTDISFSEGLVTTGYGVFLRNSGLKSVTLPKSIRTIGDNTFNGCTKLAEINLPEGLTTIGNYAFGWTPITGIKLPDSVTTLGTGAFSYCTSLKSISIPANIKRIDEGTFDNCTALTDANLSTVTSIGEVAFIGCRSLTNVSMPIVTSIESYAFKGCASLTNIQLPATLTSIGINPFIMADKLVAISVDPANQSFVTQDEGILYSKDLTKVYAYPNARTAKTLVLPATVTTIKAEAFHYTSIENVTLPAGIKTVEEAAFGASQLKSLLLPESIENIGNAAFGGTPIAGEVVIPKSVKTMGTNAFFASNIKSVVINSSIDLSDDIFGLCEKLETVKINDNVKKIGKYAFASCTRLKNVKLPKSLKVIRSGAFKSCTGLVEISLPKGLINIGEAEASRDPDGKREGTLGCLWSVPASKR